MVSGVLLMDRGISRLPTMTKLPYGDIQGKTEAKRQESQ